MGFPSGPPIRGRRRYNVEMKIISVVIVFACGLYELDLATGPRGHGWQFMAGFAFIVFALVRGFYLLRQKQN